MLFLCFGIRMHNHPQLQNQTFQRHLSRCCLQHTHCGYRLWLIHVSQPIHFHGNQSSGLHQLCSHIYWQVLLLFFQVKPKSLNAMRNQTRLSTCNVSISIKDSSWLVIIDVFNHHNTFQSCTFVLSSKYILLDLPWPLSVLSTNLSAIPWSHASVNHNRIEDR